MNGEPKTVRELWLWIKGELEGISYKIESLQKQPDNVGKWLVRLSQFGIFFLQAVLLYLMLRSKK